MAAKNSSKKATLPRTRSLKASRNTEQQDRLTPSVTESSSDMSKSQKRFSLPRLSKKTLGILAGLTILALVLFLLRSWFVVAVVNGQPITRFEFQREIEQQSGRQVLDGLITRTLIAQEARKQNITVSSEEIDAAIKDIEKTLSESGQSLDSALAMRGLSRDQFIQQIRIQKEVEKLLEKQTSVSAEEVDAYIKTNASSLPSGISGEELNRQVTEQLKQEKLSQEFPSFLQGLQQNANIIQVVSF
jgi:foldase protein PrsA